MRALKPSLIALLLVVFSWITSFPQVGPSHAYNQGDKFFQEGQYKKAIESYEKALGSSIRNSYIFYNLGCAYYKDGQALSPRDGDIIYNLELLRLLLKDNSEVPSSGGMIGFFSRLPGFFTLRELSWGESILYLLFTLSIIGYLLVFRPGLRRAMRYLVTIFTPLFFVSLLLFAARTYELNFKQRAVILSTQLEARSGPGEGYNKILTLHEGIEVEIRESREGWCLIKLPNGLGGWIEEDSLLRI